MSSATTHFTLPDLHAMCPLEFGKGNPHYKEASAASRAWANQYGVFTDKKRAAFVQGCNELLCCRAYPYAGYEEFRTCCDFVNLLFVVDELSDAMDGKDARATCQLFLRAMVDPEYQSDSILVKMTKEFRARMVSVTKPRCFSRFLVHCANYVEAVSKEAELREKREVLSMQSYTHLRRENSAVRPCFALAEMALGLNLPDEVFDDPTFTNIYFAGVDMVCWSNDVYSYNMEQAMGHTGNNVVTVIMQDKGIDLQAAADEVGVIFGQCMRTWSAEQAKLPSWGKSVDADVGRYVEALGQWVVGNLEWSFETPRYFGAMHDEVLRTRLVTLKPQEGESDDEE
ncbi:hypothetical protein SERLA73DRAFT_108414 [Serpula lacrymans var. lacrymans S7.3]|uniref:Terpene synthase n=2 Tax=Serpula lacrymans var. lacrymans TaxID=341189 RepID=F8PYY1_SERL3|nr:putative terpene cyclase [Serpula lacrymans var. lacrymans S7.9]EGN99094.1 hypothetical protein SERLA73DRAFT_108414 [Serpula lacrymans var. lacrymans S7.3]EGO24666.1 putative terpene cyclase [Serpula lacrymans var. lacrymans S7.9]